MRGSALITTESKNQLPVLIVDKVGIIGESLAENIKQESLVILVSGKTVVDPNILHVPYDKKIPVIPDNTYSHIFLIDEDGAFLKNLIPPFIKKAKHDDSVFSLVLKKGIIQKDFEQSLFSSYSKIKLIITGDIFAKDFIFDSKTDINRFIKEVKDNKKIEIPGDGTSETLPVFLEDVTWGILQAGFIEEKNEVFLIYPQGAFTLLSVARIFQKIDPNIKIDFIREDKIRKALEIEEGKNLLDENYDLESKIKQIEFGKEKFEEIRREEEHNRSFEFSLPTGLNKIFLACLLTIFLVLLMPIIFTFGLAGFGGLLLQGAISQAEAGKLESAKNFVSVSYYAFFLSESSFALVEKEARIVGIENKLTGMRSKLELGKETSFTVLNLFEGIKNLEKILTGSSGSSEKEFNRITNDIKSALVYYQKQKEAGGLPASLTKNLDDIVAISSATIESWPELFGFKGERKYLILLQNNMELRPGGGFIGSFALATLNKGKLSNFKIYDVYDADGQLKGHIEPPFVIRRYLNSPNWYLRDSNFDIDFSKSAQASAVFLLSELKQPVDGVVAVDLSFARNLLEAVGEVKVVDYTETVSSNNLFQVTQEKVEAKFFPGSTQKKDFLKSLYNSIENKISADKTISYLNVLQSLVRSISEKHILLAFNKPNIEALFSVNGWGGSLFDDRESSPTSINDFVGINEANFGANKVNYYVSRSMSLNVSIKDNGQVENTIKISYKNNAPKNSGTKGLYKNYLRLILPKGATLTKIEVDGVAQKLINAITEPNLYEAKNFKPPVGLEISKEELVNKSVFGFLVNIEPEALKNIVVTYNINKKFDMKEASLSYSLKIYKQPGIDTIPFGVVLNIPANLNVVDYPKSAIIKEKAVIVSENIVKDTTLNFSISKK